jgi:septum formation protein
MTISAIWNPQSQLVLASKSATRRELLEAAGIPFEIDSPTVDERSIESDYARQGGTAEGLSSALARAKALEASRRRPQSLCLGADQVLSLGGEVFHKPDSLSQAASQIARMSGRTHRLTSAFAIAQDGEVVGEGQDSVDMTMRALAAEQIALYLQVAGSGVLTSVGAYQVERFGMHLFERIDGDHTTVLGLPMLKLLPCLRTLGALKL